MRRSATPSQCKSRCRKGFVVGSVYQTGHHEKGSKAHGNCSNRGDVRAGGLAERDTVLVDFWAEWCGPCHAVAPVLEKIVEERPDELKLVKVNIDEEQALSQRYGVMSIPTMILFKDGEPAAAAIGAQPKSALERSLGLAAYESRDLPSGYRSEAYPDKNVNAGRSRLPLPSPSRRAGFRPFGRFVVGEPMVPRAPPFAPRAHHDRWRASACRARLRPRSALHGSAA